MNASQTTAGRQFIAGRRVASGEATLLSLRAVDGEATGHRFIRLPARRPPRPRRRRSRRLPFIHRPRRSSGRTFSAPLPMNWTRWGGVFAIAEQETALPLARLQGERARTSGQLRMLAGVILRGDTFAARIDTALADRQPLPRRTCVNISRR